MWELEGWTPKNWCFWPVVLEKTLESPLDCKEIQPVHSEGDQPWDFFGRNDAKAETPVLWLPHAKSWLIGKDSDAGRDWGHEEKGMTEDEMAGWHHRLDGREFEWTPGDGDGQGALACCSSWRCKESDTTEWLNLTELNWLCFLSISQVSDLETLTCPNNQQDNISFYCHYGRLFGENIYCFSVDNLHKQAGNNAFSGWNNMRHFLFKGKKMPILQTSLLKGDMIYI